jgi:hypothetical protein
MTGKVAVKENTILYPGPPKARSKEIGLLCVDTPLGSIKMDWRLTKTKPIICE